MNEEVSIKQNSEQLYYQSRSKVHLNLLILEEIS
jgi:hypothetical protein